MEDLLEMPPRYGIGQEVWVVLPVHHHMTEICSCCHGEGTLETGICDVCRGSGRIGYQYATKYEILDYESFIVRSIQLDNGFFTYTLVRPRYEAGHLDVLQKQIYSSKREAGEAAERLNKEMRHGSI